MEEQSFYANGKLLITGEYLVLKGALALAVPTVMGQSMTVRPGDSQNGGWGDQKTMRRGDGVIMWRSYYQDECWFEGEFGIPDRRIIKASDEEKARFISKLLNAADEMNPNHLSGVYNYEVETRLGFDPEWGLGSSSSLTVLIADWFSIDPWELFKKTQSGSGYDITCARVLNPIWFRLTFGTPISQKVIFNPPFSDNLAFVYSGRKQDSAMSIEKFERSGKISPEFMERITAISRDLPAAKTLQEFNRLIEEHEEILSQILQIPGVRVKYQDFPGSMKSLGAWGGDFILASSDIGYNEIKSYFSKKQLDIVFSFDEMVLGPRW